MTIAKLTASIILIIMAATWAMISVKLCDMVEVSGNFMYLGGVLATIVTGGEISDFLQKYRVPK